jgi:hypothetical protein
VIDQLVAETAAGGGVEIERHRRIVRSFGAKEGSKLGEFSHR